MLSITVDARALTRDLTALRRSLPYATANALNATAKEIQTNQREGQRRRFTVRRPGFIDRLVKINRPDFAKYNKLEATVRIQGPGSVTGADPVGALLARHEDGGTFVRPDSEPFFTPSDYTQPTPRSIIPRRLYPSALGLHTRRGIDGGTVGGARKVKRTRARRVSETQVYFVVPIGNPRGRTPGIYQRQSKDRRDIQLIWFYTKRARLKPRLGFRRTGMETAEQRWGPNMVAALEHEVARRSR